MFVEPACGERDIVVTMTVWCMFMCPCVHAFELVGTITFTVVDGFQKNLT